MGMQGWQHRLGLLVALVLTGALGAQPPGWEDEVARIRRDWELAAMQTALQDGFLGVAENLATRLLQSGELPPDSRAAALNARLQAALARGDLAAAAAIREQLQAAGLVPQPLLEAFLHYFQGATAEAEAVLARLVQPPHSVADLAWRRMLQALILTREGATERAHEAFLEAAQLAPSAIMRDHFEAVRYRNELATGAASEAVVGGLRESVRSLRGQRSGFEAARLLAIALHRSGDSAAAVEVLNTHLALPGLREFGLRQEFLLLLGMVAGAESARGRLALSQLVAEGRGGEIPGMALNLLAEAARTAAEREILLADLRAWLEAMPAHPLADRLLAYRAHLLFEARNFAEAETSAQQLVRNFPNSPHALNGLRLLAHVSWSLSPPRYRTAADYLNQLRQRLPPGDEALETGILIADCFFLNGDFASAADAYAGVLREAPARLAPRVFFQRVLAKLRAGRLQAAADFIDASRQDPRLDLDALWRAEWNLLDALRRSGRSAEAFARIGRALQQDAPLEPVPPQLLLRMRWIDARLTLEAGQPGAAAQKALDLVDSLQTGALAAIPGELARELESDLLLLLGEARFALGERSAALESFSLLRTRHPQSGAAVLSYLVESRSDAASDNLVSAQQSLIALVDRFPDSEYAPIALWEAALNAEQRGLNVHLQEAIAILERLVSAYPQHGLVFYARLRQGDIARRLNDFPTALLLYERVLAQFPDHAERFRAELSRADCLMAMGSADPARFESAAVLYERICLLPVAPPAVRLEAGYKWAHALRQQQDPAGFERVLWLVYRNFVLDPDLSQILRAAPAGRYWMARTLLELGALRLENGDAMGARELYGSLLRLDLPGAALARARLESLTP